MTIRLTTELSTAIIEVRSEGKQIFSELRENSYEFRIVNLVKLSLKNEGKVIFRKTKTES